MDPIQATLTSAIQQITSALILGLVLVATTLIGLAVQKGVQYLKVKLGDTQLGTLKEIAQTVVRSLEQNPIFKDLDPTAKKERAVLAITTWCEKNNIPITHEFIDSLIEEAVQVMNVEMGKYIDGDLLDMTGPEPVVGK